MASGRWKNRVATCPFAQNGLPSIVSQPRHTNPATVAELLALLHDVCADDSHQFWSDDIALATNGMVNPRIALTSGALTDVYSLALAVKHAGRVVTLDIRIAREAMINAGAQHLVLL